MLKNFKKFIMRGNLIDLAAAVILGTAFGAVVASLVKDVITPFIAAIGHQPDLSKLTFSVGDGLIGYGTILNTVLNFLIVAAVVFTVLKSYETLLARRASGDEAELELPAPSNEEVLLGEIRDLLSRQSTRL